MKGLILFKWPLIIFLIGFLSRTIGVLLKIRHWPLADEFLTIGFIICIIAIIFAIGKLIFLKRNENN